MDFIAIDETYQAFPDIPNLLMQDHPEQLISEIQKNHSGHGMVNYFNNYQAPQNPASKT